jgi:5-methylcytosine-specific restriction endonuclease McrA
MGTPMELIRFYQSKKWKTVRAYIKRRDQGICQKCGGIGQEVHHKVPLTLRNYQTELAIDPENLILLCKSCHDAERGSQTVREDVMFDEYGRMKPRTKTPPAS